MGEVFYFSFKALVTDIYKGRRIKVNILQRCQQRIKVVNKGNSFLYDTLGYFRINLL